MLTASLDLFLAAFGNGYLAPASHAEMGAALAPFEAVPFATLVGLLLFHLRCAISPCAPLVSPDLRLISSPPQLCDLPDLPVVSPSLASRPSHPLAPPLHLPRNSP